MEKVEISQMFVDCEIKFLQATGAFMVYIREKMSSLFVNTLTFEYYKGQLNWHVVTRGDKRAFLIIDEKGFVVIICQDKLNPSQKEYLAKRQDYLEPDFSSTKENTFNVKQTYQIDEIVDKLEDHFRTRN